MILNVSNPIPTFCTHYLHGKSMEKPSLIQTSKLKWSSKPFGGVSNHLSKGPSQVATSKNSTSFWLPPDFSCAEIPINSVASFQLDAIILHESCWKLNTGDKTCQTVLIHPPFAEAIPPEYTRIHPTKARLISPILSHPIKHRYPNAFAHGSPWQQFASPSRNPFEWIWQKRDAPWTPHGMSTPHGTGGGHPTLNRDSICKWQVSTNLRPWRVIDISFQQANSMSWSSMTYRVQW